MRTSGVLWGGGEVPLGAMLGGCQFSPPLLPCHPSARLLLLRLPPLAGASSPPSARPSSTSAGRLVRVGAQLQTGGGGGRRGTSSPFPGLGSAVHQVWGPATAAGGTGTGCKCCLCPRAHITLATPVLRAHTQRRLPTGLRIKCNEVSCSGGGRSLRARLPLTRGRASLFSTKY